MIKSIYFERNPDRKEGVMWTSDECSRYYLCLEGDVFDFQCSKGLLFDVNRQLCDMPQNVHNCDLTTGITFYILKDNLLNMISKLHTYEIRIITC